MPRDRSVEAMSADIPITYVPARNTVFLSLALAWAEVLGSFDIYMGVNAIDYSVRGDSLVWVRTARWARLMPIQDFYTLPAEPFETVAVDLETMQLAWRRVTGRFRHPTGHKRCFQLGLERGQEITITEDHSLFTIDEETARLRIIKGAEVAVGTPLVVPFDLTSVVGAWMEDLQTIDLTGLVHSCQNLHQRRSIVEEDGYITNRLGRARIPVQFPITDDFLYLVGLWLAEGGKDPASTNGTLAFSIGGIPGAVDTFCSYFRPYHVVVRKSPLNDYDYHICSSVFAALFRYLGLFGTAKSGTKRFPCFFWNLSQRQRRIVISGLWDGDGSHLFNGEISLAQKSHSLIRETYHCLSLDGIFPVVKRGPHSQLILYLPARKTSEHL